MKWGTWRPWKGDETADRTEMGKCVWYFLSPGKTVLPGSVEAPAVLPLILAPHSPLYKALAPFMTSY